MGASFAETVADRLEIADLCARYARAIDTQDWDGLDTVFTPDAEIDYTSSGGTSGRYPEVKAWLAQVLPMFSMTQHYVTNTTVEFGPDGASATARSDLYNPMSLKGEDGSVRTFEVGGLYLDELVRTPDGWRIAKRVEVQLWLGGDAPTAP